jgi:hypothetical protein
MNIKTINLTAESGTRKELCMKKIVHTVEMLQRVDEEKTAIGTTLCGYMECCKDIGYISDDEYKMLREMVIGIASAKGCVIVTEVKS